MDGGRYALLIGNWEYQNSEFRKLVSPAHDVQALKTVFADPKIGGFDRVDVLENAPEVKVRRSISSFFKGRSYNDMLLLYFSGHGIKDMSGRFYLTSIDTDPNDLLGTGIAAEFVHSAVQSCRSRKKVLLIDSCFGGAFIKGMTMKSGSRVTADQIVGDATGLVIVTATDALTYAFENEAIVDDSKASVFTKHLVYGLRTGEADLGHDGEVRIDELYRYVRGQVIREIPGQSPKKWELEDGGDLVIALNANPSLIKLPTEIQDAFDSSLTQVRLAALPLLTDLARKPCMRQCVVTTLEKLLGDDSHKIREGAQDALSQLGTRAPNFSPINVVQDRHDLPLVQEEAIDVSPTISGSLQGLESAANGSQVEGVKSTGKNVPVVKEVFSQSIGECLSGAESPATPSRSVALERGENKSGPHTNEEGLSDSRNDTTSIPDGWMSVSKTDSNNRRSSSGWASNKWRYLFWLYIVVPLSMYVVVAEFSGTGNWMSEAPSPDRDKGAASQASVVDPRMASITAVAPKLAAIDAAASAASTPNQEDAITQTLAAKNQGDADALNQLGEAYAAGRGVSQSYTEAVKCFRKAAEQGDSYGQQNLGSMYQKGYGVPQDFAEAVKWFQKSADQGNPYGQHSLGWMYENGQGVTKNYAIALKLYRKSADQGNPAGQRAVGFLYDNGFGVPKDAGEADRWYRKAADQGDVNAQYNLGSNYEDGVGVPKDASEAVKWYRKAADQGDDDARVALKRLGQ